MTKWMTHDAIDAAYAYIADRADLMALCSGAPVSARDAALELSQGGRMLCTVSLNSGLGHGDFDVGPGFLSGRRMVISRRQGLVAESGHADHLVIVNSSRDGLLIVTRLNKPRDLVAGEAIVIESFSHEITDPE